VEKEAIKPTIFEHPEFALFTAGMSAHFEEWKRGRAARLKALDKDFLPKDLISDLSQDLLIHYAGRPLIDNYDIYQHLMDYWEKSMQDDCYLISADGWRAETYRVMVKDKKGREKDKGWACDLVPKDLIVNRYFAQEQAAIDQLAAELDGIAARMAELEEENGGEEGAFSELDKVNKANVAARLKEIRGDKEAKEEAAVLSEWLKLSEQEPVLKKRLKDAEAQLDAKAYAHYTKLREEEIRALVVEDKWMATLEADIHSELDRISQALACRIKLLAERYDEPLPKLVDYVGVLSSKVDEHLEKMGFAWN
jgi:type I restriction enzyme M protein